MAERPSTQGSDSTRVNESVYTPDFYDSSDERDVSERKDPSTISGETPREDEGEQSGKERARHLVMVISLFMTLFMPALDQSIVSTALPGILSGIGAASSNEGYVWVGATYALGQAVVQPLFGQASEAIGRKCAFMIAIFLFAAGNVLCGAANDLIWLITARTVEGVGAGGITSLVFILIGDLVRPEKRGKYQGYVGATYAAASVLGPVLGGGLAEKADWRWCFFIHLPICTVCLGITFGLLKVPRKPVTLREAPKLFDIPGTFTVGASVVLIILALQWASQGAGWTSVRVLTCAILSAVCLISFVFLESRAKRPVMPLRFFTNRTRIGAYLGALLHAISYSALVYYVPVYFQGVRGETATQTGISLLPLVLSFGIVSMASGHVITATKKCRAIIWAGFVIATAGSGLLISLDAKSPVVMVSVLLIITGIGIGPNFNALLTPIHASFDESSPASDIALSASAYAFIRSIGASLGIGIGGLACFNELGHLKLGDEEGPTGITQAIDAARALVGAEQERAVDGIYHAIGHVFITITAVMGAGLLASLLLQHTPQHAPPVKEPSGEPKEVIEEKV